jgi:hypothetical protein
MSVIDDLELRLIFTLTTMLREGHDPRPMLAFARGELQVGVAVTPPMPPTTAERLNVYTCLAHFMAQYGATEAVFAADVMVAHATEEQVASGDLPDPNEVVDAEHQLHMIRLPAGHRRVIPYWIDDRGHAVFDRPSRMVAVDREPELLIQLLRLGLGFAPAEPELRAVAKVWLYRKIGAMADIAPEALRS